MSRITITIDTPDTLERRDFAFEIDEALIMGFKHDYAMWTVEPKRGRWIKYIPPIPAEDDGVDAWDCSECGAMVSKPTNYCPHCGSRMDKE